MLSADTDARTRWSKIGITEDAELLRAGQSRQDPGISANGFPLSEPAVGRPSTSSDVSLPECVALTSVPCAEGKRKMNEHPASGSLRASSVPPNAVAIRCATAVPRPTPGNPAKLRLFSAEERSRKRGIDRLVLARCRDPLHKGQPSLSLPPGRGRQWVFPVRCTCRHSPAGCPRAERARPASLHRTRLSSPESSIRRSRCRACVLGLPSCEPVGQPERDRSPMKRGPDRVGLRQKK